METRYTRTAAGTWTGSQSIGKIRGGGQPDGSFAQLPTEKRTKAGGTDSGRDSTVTNTKRLRFHGGSKNPNDPWNRYLRPSDGGVARKMERGHQKNHIVGRSAEAGIFRGTVSRLTESDHLGGQLLSSPSDKMFSDMAQIEYPTCGLFHGTNRIRVDVVQQKRGGV